MRYWKCIKSGSENKFTVGEIYSTWEDESGLIANNGETGWINPSRMNKVAKFEEIEEGENKMEDLRELIKPCYVVVRRDGSVCGVFETSKGIKLQTSLGSGMCFLEDYNENLTKKDSEFEDTDIMKVYGLSTYSFDISINNRPLIWKREETPIKSPTQLKLEELEKQQREIADEMEKLRKEL